MSIADRKDDASKNSPVYKYVDIIFRALVSDKAKNAAKDKNTKNPKKAEEIRERLADNLNQLYHKVRFGDHSDREKELAIVRNELHNIVLPEYVNAYVIGRYKSGIGPLKVSQKDPFLDFLGDTIAENDVVKDMLKTVYTDEPAKEKSDKKDEHPKKEADKDADADKDRKAEEESEAEEMKKDKSTWLILSTLKQESCNDIREKVVLKLFRDTLADLSNDAGDKSTKKNLFINRWKAIERMGGAANWNAFVDDTFEGNPDLIKAFVFPDEKPYVKEKTIKAKQKFILEGNFSFMEMEKSKKVKVLSMLREHLKKNNVIDRLDRLINKIADHEKRQGYRMAL